MIYLSNYWKKYFLFNLGEFKLKKTYRSEEKFTKGGRRWVCDLVTHRIYVDFKNCHSSGYMSGNFNKDL